MSKSKSIVPNSVRFTMQKAQRAVRIPGNVINGINRTHGIQEIFKIPHILGLTRFKIIQNNFFGIQED